jgi:hypothetical protein
MIEEEAGDPKGEEEEEEECELRSRRHRFTRDNREGEAGGMILPRDLLRKPETNMGPSFLRHISLPVHFSEVPAIMLHRYLTVSVSSPKLREP